MRLGLGGRLNATKTLGCSRYFWGRRVSGSFVCLRLDDLFDLGFEDRNIVIDRVPDQRVVHAEITVDQAVAHASHRFPLDVGMACFEIRRDALGCFTNDLKAPDKCTFAFLVGFEGGLVEMDRCGAEKFRFIQNMFQERKRRVGHILLLSGCFRRCAGSGLRQ